MTDSSILFQPATIALLANSNALADLELFLYSLQLWNHPLPPLHFFCTAKVEDWLLGKYKGKITCDRELEKYEGLTREKMEKMPSERGRPNLFSDFTEEKCRLLEKALSALTEEEKPRGVLFCDADLLWLGPLPQIAQGNSVVLSPHQIDPRDEAKYGRYNAGLLWTNSFSAITTWKEACISSRFFEQAALESLEVFQPTLFPVQVNYGWWRMFQSPNGQEAQQKAWSIKRDPQERNSGLQVDGQPLVCIHTHWKTTDHVTKRFNDWVSSKLALLKSQSKVKLIAKRLQISL